VATEELEIKGGETVDLEVEFKPTGAAAAQANIALDFGGNFFEIQATGQGVSPVPEINMSETELDFGLNRLGKTVSRSLNVRNAGGTDLVIDSIRVSDGPFVVAPVSLVIPKDDSARVNVTYTPLDEEVIHSSLRIFANVAEIPLVRLKAEAIQSFLRLNREEIHWEKVLAGRDSVQTLEMVNIAHDTVQVSLGDLSLPFRVDGVRTTRLAAGETWTLPLRFSPRSAGSYEQNLSIREDPENSREVHLLATAIQLGIPDSVLFGRIALGDSARASFLITNPATRDLHIHRVEVDREVFRITNESQVIPGNSSRLLDLIFVPAAIQEAIGQLVVETDAGTYALTLVGRGLLTHWYADPDIIDFGETVIGATQLRSVSVENPDSFVVRINQISLADETAQLRIAQISRSFPIFLSPGQRLKMAQVAFTPSVPGPLPPSVALQILGPGGTRHVAITGRGRERQPGVFFTPIDTLQFGRVAEGDDALQPLSLYNKGQAELRVVLKTSADEFEVVEPETLTVAPGKQRITQIRFTPQHTGRVVRNLEIGSNDTAKPLCILPMSGQGGGILLRPLSLDLGEVPEGGRIDTVLTLTNLSNASIEGSIQVRGGGRHFTVTPSEFFLDAEERLPIRLSFAPLLAEEFAPLVEVQLSDTRRLSASVRAAGIAAPLISTSTTHLDVGTVQVGQVAEVFLPVRNNGSGPLTLYAVTTEDLRFQVDDRASFPTVVASRTESVLPIRFSPDKEGNHESVLTILSNDPANPQLEVSLEGRGVPPPPLRQISLALDADINFRNRREVRAFEEGFVEVISSRLGIDPRRIRVDRVSQGSVVVDFVILPTLGDTKAVTPDEAWETLVQVVEEDPESLIDLGEVKSIDARVTPEVTPEPRIVVRPDSLLFGSLEVGQTVTQNLSIDNHGDGVLMLEQIRIDDDQLRVFPRTLLVAPDDIPQVLNVEMTPKAFRKTQGILRIDSNDPTVPVRRIPWRYEPNWPQARLLTESIAFGAPVEGRRSGVLGVQNVGSSLLVIDLMSPDEQIRFDLDRLVVPPSRVRRVAVHYTGSGGQGTLILQTNSPLEPQIPVLWRADELLQVVSVFPAEGAIEVGTQAEITVQFNQELKQLGRLSTVQARVIPRPRDMKVEVKGRTVLFRMELEEDTLYRLMVLDAESEVGSRLEKPFETSFATGRTVVPTGSIAGTVQFEDNAPLIGDVWVVNESKQLVATAPIDPEGRFQMDNIAAGFYEVFAQEANTDFSVAFDGVIEVQDGLQVQGIDFLIPIEQPLPPPQVVVDTEVDVPSELEGVDIDSLFTLPVRMDWVEDLTGFMVRISFTP